MQLPSLIGKYELLEFLGGGMSHVYRGRDTIIERPVVVKILTDEGSADPEAKARFLHEAKIAGNIQHENIVSVYDYGEHGGRPFIVMEYLKGEDLRDAIRGGRAGTLSNRLNIALQIAEALGFVHERGIVHRDVKPENIHIDAHGRIKLMDFGIAKTADLSLTRTGMAMGTPFYMAPEQVSGRPTTPLVDIYAYGMLFFELLTGTRGITGQTMEQVFFQILNQPLDRTAMENAGAPPSIRELIMRCTAKQAAERPQGFRTVIDTLRESLGLSPHARTRTVETPSQPVEEAAFATPSGSVDLPAQGPLIPRVETSSGESVVADSRIVPPSKRRGRMVVIGLVGVALLLAAATGVWVWSRQPVKVPGMIFIHAGTFTSGSDRKVVELAPYYIDETEVSNADFAAFCQATGCTPPSGAPDLPVVGIIVAQARAYASWKGKRLPTALEWERAAQGAEDGSRYPWGSNEDASLANVRDNPLLAEHVLKPVRSFAAYPEYQMAGNAWEIVDGTVTPSANAVAMFATLVTPPPTAEEKWIEIRGGSFNTPLAAAVNFDGAPIPERYSSADIGFRCAKNP